MKQWEKEKAEGIEQNFEDEEISGELQSKLTNMPVIDSEEVEIPPVPVQVVRY